jgi:hypothetical protein
MLSKSFTKQSLYALRLGNLEIRGMHPIAGILSRSVSEDYEAV